MARSTIGRKESSSHPLGPAASLEEFPNISYKRNSVQTKPRAQGVNLVLGIFQTRKLKCGVVVFNSWT